MSPGAGTSHMGHEISGGVGLWHLVGGKILS